MLLSHVSDQTSRKNILRILRTREAVVKPSQGLNLQIGIRHCGKDGEKHHRAQMARYHKKHLFPRYDHISTTNAESFITTPIKDVIPQDGNTEC